MRCAKYRFKSVNAVVGLSKFAGRRKEKKKKNENFFGVDKDLKRKFVET
jgi:hypothetical protein